MVAAVSIGTVVLGTLGAITTRSGAPARPILFVAGMFALVLLPQFAYHLAVATGAIPRRDLTWLPAAERAAAYGWVENEAALAVRDGDFVDPAAVFGADVHVSLGADLRAGGAAGPFAAAEAARMVVLPPDGSAIVARFADAAAAGAAAREYAAQAIGRWPPVGSDGLRTAARPGGDSVTFALAGRTLVVVTGSDERALSQRLRALGAIMPGTAAADAAAQEFWLYRPGVLPALAALLAAVCIVAFFKGAAWAGAIPPRAGARPLPAADLRQRLLAIDATGLPLAITAEDGGRRIVVTWRFADARWLDLARVRQLRYVQRLVLVPDEASRTVRVTEQQTRFDAAAGPGGVSVEWRTTYGITFFEVERGRVFGLQFDADGRPLPDPGYAWRFDVREMKAPLVEAVTGAGWEWRPTLWNGPERLRWLTG